MSDLKVLKGAVIPEDSDKKILEHSLKITKTKPTVAQAVTVKTIEKK